MKEKHFYLLLLIYQFFILPSFCNTSKHLFNFIDLFTGASLNIPVKELIQKENDFIPYSEKILLPPSKTANELIEFSTISYARINLNHIEGIVLIPTQKTSICCYDNIFNNISTIWGIALHLYNDNSFYKTQIVGGMVSFSSSISKLKYPCLTLSSTLSRNIQTEYQIRPSIPTKITTIKPLSIAIKISPNPRINFLPGIEAYYCETGEYALNFSVSTKGKTSTSFGITGGMFCYGGKNDSSWFSKEVRIQNDLYPAITANFSLSGSFLRFSLSGGMHSAPLCSAYNLNIFEKAIYWVRSQNILKLGPFGLIANTFFSDEGLVSTDGTNISTTKQFQIIPQYTFILFNAPLRTGAAFCIDTKKDTQKKNYNLYRARFDTDYKKGSFQIKFKESFSHIEQETNNTYSTLLSLNKSLINSSFFISTGFESNYVFPFFQNEQETTYSTQAKFTCKNTCIKTISLKSTSIIENQGYKSGSVTLDITFSNRAQKVKWNGKITISTIF